MENQINNNNTVVEDTVVEDTVVKPAPKKRAPKKQPVVVETNTETNAETNAETNGETTDAETTKPAPKKRAPKKQPVVVETNAETNGDTTDAETTKPAPKKRAPKKQPVVVDETNAETNGETTDAETTKPAPKKRAPKKNVSEDQFNTTYGTSFNKEEIDHINWLSTTFNVHIHIAIKYVQENSLCETKPNDDFCCKPHKNSFQSSLENSEEVNLKAEHLLIIGETNGAIFARKKAKKEWEKTAKWGPEEEKKYWANQMSVEDIGKCLGYLVSIGFLNKLDWSHM